MTVGRVVHSKYLRSNEIIVQQEIKDIAVNDAFLISHLWLFQIPPFPNRRVLRVDGMIARAGVAVIVDDTACLEMGIHRHRAHILKAVCLQLLGDLVRQAVADGDFSLLTMLCFLAFFLGFFFQPLHRFQVGFFHRGQRLRLEFAVFRLRLVQRLLMANASGVLQ